MKSLRSGASLAVLVFAFSMSASLASYADTLSASGPAGLLGTPHGTDGGDGVYNLSGDFRDSLYVTGGSGGDGSYMEDGSGGNGGKATIEGVITLGNHGSYWHTAQYDAIGGNGGSAHGVGQKAGNGGAGKILAEITVDPTNTQPSSFTLNQRGGHGGAGYNGASAGDGADSIMVDAIRVLSPQPRVMRQNAIGGDAGTADDPAATQGKAGNAVSSLTTNESLSYITVQQVSASGGNGASSGSSEITGTAGGDALAINQISSTNRSGSPWWLGNNTTSALGGRGGIGSKGGDANAIFQSESRAEGTGYVWSAGGDGGTGWVQESGNGGNALAGGTIKVSPSESDTATAKLELYAVGGDGGNAFAGTETNTGNGGTATVSGFASTDLSVTNASVQIVASQTGGDGGNGYDAQNGGNGADSIMDNALQASTAGTMNLQQTAQGGNGGFSQSRNGGKGGSATVRTVFEDSTAQTINITNTAQGGLAGASHAATAGQAGNATTIMDVASTVGANLWLSASSLAGNVSGYDYGNVNGVNGATADSQVSGKSAGEVSTFARSLGGQGLSASGAGNKAGNGGAATAFARAESTGGSNVTSGVELRQGQGGYGANGADGGDGLDAFLLNAAQGLSQATTNLIQLAVSGRAGESSDGAAGRAGTANSIFAINDTTSTNFLTANTAIAGDGGNGSNGAKSTQGGDALAQTDLVTTGSAGDGTLWSGNRNYVSSYGGAGGYNQNGGAATSLLNIEAVGRATGTVDARAGNGYGNGTGNGDGGKASAQGSMLIHADSADRSVGALSVVVTGGSGAGSGHGGSATGSASATGLGMDPYSSLSIDLAQYGGNGGDSIYTGNAGNGADSFLANAVSGETSGVLNLRQSAYAGHGGYAADGLGGRGGEASSMFSLNDAKARQLQLFVSAAGGNAGSATQNDTGLAGAATVGVDVNASVAESLNIQAIATGGNNNQGYYAYNQMGHDGSNASVQAQGIAAGSSSVYAEAVAGTGLSANGNGQKAGNGGNASAEAYAESQNGNTAQATVYHRAGNGGYGYNGANAGDGVAAFVRNKVHALTTDLAQLTQVAFGGAGGASEGGYAGSAGEAVSVLEFEETNARMLHIQNEARGGSGGNGSLGSTAGGNAVAQTLVTTTSGTLGSWSGNQAQTLALGGAGGYSKKGGDAHAEVNATVLGHAWNNIAATAGNGGDFNSYGSDNKNGGDGGVAEAFGNVVIEGPSVADGFETTSILNLAAIGGNGAIGYGAGNKGGDGGMAVASANMMAVDPANTENLSILLQQKAGDGGRGQNGANAGNGASSALHSAVTGRTAGNLNLRQIAAAGSGGWTDASFSETGLGSVGQAGQASSILSLIDSQASKLELATESYGGSVYKNMNTGMGPDLVAGSAYANTIAVSTRIGAQVKGESFAVSGDLRNPWSPLYSSGVAQAQTYTSGMGLNTTVLGYAKATGGTGKASSTSVLENSLGDKVETMAQADIVKPSIGTSASTGALSGYDNGWVYAPKTYENAVSFGNILPKDIYGYDIKRSNLGGATADFTVIADGRMGANVYTSPYDESDAVTGSYSMSASYSFSNLSAGRDLLFGFTGYEGFNKTFDSLSFSLTQDGNQLFAKTFDDYGSFESFFNAPLNLGNVSGATKLVVSMSQILTGVKDYAASWTGYMTDYAFVTAVTGTITGAQQHVSSVPVPAALPLFGTALAGLGFLRRKTRRAAK